MDCNSLPISIVISSANHHDSTRFADVMELISDHLDSSTTRKIKSVYADKGYDSKMIRAYLKSKNIVACIPKRNFKTRRINNHDNNNYNKISLLWRDSLHG